MWLFDIGALLFGVGLIWIVLFLIKGYRSVVIFSTVISLIGGLIMFIAYYFVIGNQSIFDKMLDSIVS